MTAHIGEIRMFAGNFPPQGWAFCNGQMMAISDNEVLFQLIGTTYGGDGESTFALPNLCSRVPVHAGEEPETRTRFTVGATGGDESVTITTHQLPSHTHGVPVTSATASSSSAVGGIPAASPSEPMWSPVPGSDPAGTTDASGGSQPHDNMQPYLGINFIISLYGIFPTQA